jgi:hypothetical protein
MPADRYTDVTFNAWEFVPDVTNGPQALTRNASQHKVAHYDLLAFDSATDEYAYVPWQIPEDFDNTAGKMKVRVYYETAVTSNTAAWQFGIAGYADGEDLDAAYSNLTAIAAETVEGTTRYLSVGAATTVDATALGALTAGDLAILRINRDTSEDSALGDVNLIKLVIQYKAVGANNGRWGDTAGEEVPTDYVARWELDEGSGVAVTDSSGNSNDGTAANIAWNGAGAMGSDSLNFNGTSSIVDSFSSAPPAYGTVTGWFRSDTSLNNYVVSHYNGGNRLYVYLNNGILYGRIGANAATSIKSDLGDSYWHFFAFVYGTAAEVTQSKMYVDEDAAVSVTNAASTLSMATTYFRLGAAGLPAATDFFSGDIDDIRMYDRALTAAEVQAHYQGSGPSDLTGKRYEEKFIPVIKLVGDKTDPPSAGTRTATTEQSGHYHFLQHIDADDKYSYYGWRVPSDIAVENSTLSYKLAWETDTTDSEPAVWEVSVVSRTDNENIDVAVEVNTPIVDASDGGLVRDLNIATGRVIGAHGLVGGELAIFRVGRLSTNGADDLTDTARLLSLTIQYLTDEANNAQWS